MSKASTIATATLVAGTLDIASAFVFTAMAGGSALGMLSYVASGPFGTPPLPPSMAWGFLGLFVHYAIMTCMVTAYVLIAPRFPALFNRPILAGILYGLLLWAIMYWVVRPLRFGHFPLPVTLKGISQQWFSHLLLVGIPIAVIAKAGKLVKN